MTEAYVATAINSVRCYDLKEECIAGQGMPQCRIDAGTVVLLFIWDNILRVAQGCLRHSNGPQTPVWMSLDFLNIIGKDVFPKDMLPAPPTLPAPCRLEARHSNGQASVAWFYSAIAALNNPTAYVGTMPNGEQVELLDANADGQYVYASVRWRDRVVVLRTVHLNNLPVQLLSHDGQQQVPLFENVIAGQRNAPSGYLPNGTAATVESANLDGNYTLASVNLPMGPRVVRSVDLQGLPQRNFQTPAIATEPAAAANQAGHHQNQPHPPLPAHAAPQPSALPMPAQVTPQHADLLLYSEVRVRHVEGKPLVSYHFQKTSAQLMGTPDGTIPSNSTALLVELDTSDRGASGHCKIKWKQNGSQLDVYVQRCHIFSA